MRAALPFPVLPGKSQSDVRSIADRFYSDPDGYRESRRNVGVTLERAYWQHTEMGDFVIAYLESDKSVADALAATAQDRTPIGRFFAERAKEVHGVDITQPPPGPAPETVLEWVDPSVSERRQGMAFCAPLMPDALDKARAFASEAERSPDMTNSRRALGQSVELVTISHTPQGPVAAVYLEGNDPWEGNRGFAASTSEFDVWFKNQCKEIFPPFIDFNQPVPGVTEIFDSEKIGAPSRRT